LRVEGLGSRFGVCEFMGRRLRLYVVQLGFVGQRSEVRGYEYAFWIISYGLSENDWR